MMQHLPGQRPRLGAIVAATMALTGASSLTDFLPRESQAKPRIWHCRKCGAEFYPIRHPELCEECRR